MKPANVFPPQFVTIQVKERIGRSPFFIHQIDPSDDKREIPRDYCRKIFLATSWKISDREPIIVVCRRDGVSLRPKR
jgi:hypothetical protein